MSGMQLQENPPEQKNFPGTVRNGEEIQPVQSPGRMAWKRFLGNPFAVGGLTILLLFVIVALLARWIAPFDPAKIDLLGASLPLGSGAHLLGTDELGRDILSRLLYSSQVSLLIGFSVAVVAIVIGTLIGAVSGYYGGWLDVVFMRLVDVMNSIPLLFLNILMLGIFGSSFILMIFILAFTSWMGVARLVRGTFLQLREMQYVEAAKAIGTSNREIIMHHMIRNATAPIIVTATLMVGGAILSESALSFLGLGIQPPQTSWGQMLSNAQEFMLTNPLQAVYPGLCILIVVLSVNFIGDGIQSAIDPRRKLRTPRRRLKEWANRSLKSGT